MFLGSRNNSLALAEFRSIFSPCMPIPPNFTAFCILLHKDPKVHHLCPSTSDIGRCANFTSGTVYVVLNTEQDVMSFRALVLVPEVLEFIHFAEDRYLN